jgi:galactose mutarotase-like enzyme
MQFKIQNHLIKATFSTLGAELISLKSADKEYIWEGNPEFWSKHSPILFPIIGELKNNIYLFEEKEYRLPRHGFARAKEFEVVEQSDNSIVFSLKSDSETLKVYPFHFELQIEYILVENKLEVHYKVENTSQEKMYFSIGGHPAFALPEHFEKYSLQFDCDKKLIFSLLEDNLLSDKSQLLETNNNHLSLNYQLFEKDALVFKKHQIQSVTIKEAGRDFLKISFEGFPDLGIWTKGNAPFICIEPWFGHADEVKTNQNFKEKAGRQLLEKDASFTAIYTVEIFK